MTTPVFAPRFALGEEVRLCTTVQQAGTSRTFPSGVAGYVEKLLSNGAYEVRTTGAYGGYELQVQESEMEEARLAARKPALPEGTGVQGIVERVALRTHAGTPVAFVVLKDRREVGYPEYRVERQFKELEQLSSRCRSNRAWSV